MNPNSDVYESFFVLVAGKSSQSYKDFIQTLPLVLHQEDPFLDAQMIWRKQPLQSPDDIIRQQWLDSADGDDVPEAPGSWGSLDEATRGQQETVDGDGIQTELLRKGSSGFILDGPGHVQVDNFCDEVSPPTREEVEAEYRPTARAAAPQLLSRSSKLPAGTTGAQPVEAASKLASQHRQRQQQAAVPAPLLNQTHTPQPPHTSSSSSTHLRDVSEPLPLLLRSPTPLTPMPPSDLQLLPTSPPASARSCHDLPLLPGECCLGDSPAEPAAAEGAPVALQRWSPELQHTADTCCPDQSNCFSEDHPHSTATGPRLTAATHIRTARQHSQANAANGDADAAACTASSPASCPGRTATDSSAAREHAAAGCNNGGRELSSGRPAVAVPGAGGQGGARGAEPTAGEAACLEPVEEFRLDPEFDYDNIVLTRRPWPYCRQATARHE